MKKCESISSGVTGKTHVFIQLLPHKQDMTQGWYVSGIALVLLKPNKSLPNEK